MGAISINEQALQLLEEQKREWDLAGNNYEGLKTIEVKDVTIGAAQFRLQFNPARIVSSAAKVDPKSIQERKCFLCKAHLPVVQRGIMYGQDKYIILVNPFPIFNKHLTIPMMQHTDQLIGGRIGDMLTLAKELPSFSLFYNGPKCGASAPDHFHFQAAETDVMPVENDFTRCKKVKLAETAGVLVETIEDYVRKVVVFSSSNKEALGAQFEKVMAEIGRLEPKAPEAMINLVVRYMDEKWVMFLFPRREHRPSQFFAEGDAQIVFSPASVDFGGMLIFPRKEDFEKMTPAIITDMFEQVSFSNENWAKLTQYITEKL